MNKAHIDSCIGKYKSQEFLKLIRKWAFDLEHKRILKTDLREEAYGEDEILFSLTSHALSVYGLDISEETVKTATLRKIANKVSHNYLAADVRKLPFKNDSFDVILSSSTLDHFTTLDDLKKSLLELRRVLHPQGIIIVALNNKFNINFYLMLKLEKALGLISYPVQFYSTHKLRKIMDEVGLAIQDKSYIVHIISPLNGILLLLRRFVAKETVDRVARISICLFKWLGNNKITNFLTGWFIALHCVKK